jgi:hypothetical protein
MMFSPRKLFALVCIVAVLLAAMNPVASALHWAILVPVLLCLAVVELAVVVRKFDDFHPPAFPSLSVLVPRAPPIA